MQVAFPRRERGIYARPCQDQARKKCHFEELLRIFIRFKAMLLLMILSWGCKKPAEKQTKPPSHARSSSCSWSAAVAWFWHVSGTATACLRGLCLGTKDCSALAPRHWKTWIPRADERKGRVRWNDLGGVGWMERVETQGFTMSCMAGTTPKQAKSTISDSGQSENIGSRKFKALASAFEISVVQGWTGRWLKAKAAQKASLVFLKVSKALRSCLPAFPA